MTYSIRRISILIALCTGLATGAAAQDIYNSSGRRVTPHSRKKQEPKGFDRDRIIYGLGIPGLDFYGGVFSIGLAPSVGYRITEDFAAGVGLGFQYVSAKDYYRFSTNGQDEFHPLHITSYSPGLWARYIVYQNFFVDAEFEYDIQHWKEYQLDNNNYPVAVKTNYNTPAVLLGAGIRQPTGERSSLYAIALYDVIQDKYSPYYQRLDFRVGFNVGF